MYESLLCLPFFQGMGKDDITAILDKVTFEFIKYNDGDTVCRCGDTCGKFIIMTQGAMEASETSPDGTYKVSEEIHPPHAIEPYSMFGHSAVYQREYRAKGNCTVLAIEKKFLFSELNRHDIFTINLLNIISLKAQKLNGIIWDHTPSSISGRITHFIASRCETLHGRKSITIKMERLATILCETRLNISKSLNEMQEAGLLELHRKEIIIPSFNKLIEAYLI